MKRQFLLGSNTAFGRRVAVTIAIAISNWIVQIGVAAENGIPSVWKPWNAVRVYAPDLIWDSKNSIPDAASAVLPKWMIQESDDGRLWLPNYSEFASVDLNGDGVDELIVRSGEFFSGGPEFVILAKTGRRWKVIGEFQGGFTISKRTTNGYPDIETWSRHPETYHHLMKFSEGRYKRTRRTAIGKWEDRGADPPFIPGPNYAYGPQAEQFMRTHPCPSAGKIGAGCPRRVVYVTPLGRGGADSQSNMKWQDRQGK